MMDDYIYNRLPVQDVTNIVSNYVYISLFGFFKSEYTKYYNEYFKGSEKKHINYSFFKVLDKCNSEYSYTITITANGITQTFNEFKEQNDKHRSIEKSFIAFEKKK